jgi:hypothetical protein
MMKHEDDIEPCRDKHDHPGVTMCEECEREYFENDDPCQYYQEQVEKGADGESDIIYHTCALYQDARTCPIKATMCKVKTLQFVMENLEKL